MHYYCPLDLPLPFPTHPLNSVQHLGHLSPVNSSRVHHAATKPCVVINPSLEQHLLRSLPRSPVFGHTKHLLREDEEAGELLLAFHGEPTLSFYAGCKPPVGAVVCRLCRLSCVLSWGWWLYSSFV
ncbi:hypothetical protein B296_00025296 [Ensete ventricosum]|uniref:Uncharacterized protein n=1 Tax=Ensete ventricosum TaxID=4639 RepID=A0A426ZTD1_ENSVE|nr:hypothetical protein B296_00025296 [Ensete ventricosum]